MPEAIGPADARERLLALLRATRQSSLPLSDAYQQFVASECEAARISLYQPLFVPGLLQTPDYAAAVTASILDRGPDNPDVTARTQIRDARQTVVRARVADGSGPQIVAFLEESVLGRRIGGAAVQRAQLDHLVTQAEEQDHVTLVVMPADSAGHVGLGGIFELLEFSDRGDADLVFIESAVSDYVHRDADSVGLYRAKVESLARAGLGGATALTRIREIRDSLPG
jgi:hypothetical protein